MCQGSQVHVTNTCPVMLSRHKRDQNRVYNYTHTFASNWHLPYLRQVPVTDMCPPWNGRPVKDTYGIQCTSAKSKPRRTYLWTQWTPQITTMLATTDTAIGTAHSLSSVAILRVKSENKWHKPSQKCHQCVGFLIYGLLNNYVQIKTKKIPQYLS